MDSDCLMQAKPDESPMVPWTAFWVFLFVLDTALYNHGKEQNMLIEKVLNNNVVITRNERNQEMIVMGKGLAFKRKWVTRFLTHASTKNFS